ncbi:MAG: phosphate ABC transporter permease PstA [Arenicella sp.]
MNVDIEKRRANIRKRYRAEKRFKAFGVAAVAFGMLCLIVLFTDIISKGMGAFRQTYIQLEMKYDAEYLSIGDISDAQQIRDANFGGLVKKNLRGLFPELKSRKEKKAIYGLITSDVGLILRNRLLDNPELLGKSETLWLLADDDIDVHYKHAFGTDKQVGKITELQKTLVQKLVDKGQVETRFNTVFFSNSDSREPELAGIKGAVLGSLFTLMVTLVLSFPIGVATAIYLEEFAAKNKITDFIEVNINNLAAVPSVIFGLLGLAIFINFFGVPRSVPLVGGLVLTLMTLPTIIISSRAAIKAVPPSIREAALGMGASKVQTVLHHVLPLAMPGMLTGTIIGMAQALGETAPLLMIGMVAFIVDAPTGITDPATVLPVQIFLWADSPERAFLERTSAAIMVLLAFLICMNSLAVMLRKKLERRW